MMCIFRKEMRRMHPPLIRTHLGNGKYGLIYQFKKHRGGSMRAIILPDRLLY